MAVEAFAQSDTTALRERYEAAPRDVKAVTDYADALELAGDRKQAETIVREYMSRCPVVQLNDRDTYLLISRYVFENPYSNVFEYGLFVMPRMKWDSKDLTPEQKEAATARKLADMRWGVSHGDEVDKRYEVQMLLSRKLGKAVNDLCDPQWQKSGQYYLPAYDETRIRHLGRLVEKGSVIGKDAMRAKLRIAEAIAGGNLTKAMRYLCSASSLDMQGINGPYMIGMMNILADRELAAADRQEAIDALMEQIRLSEERGTNHNYYTVLGRLYSQAGDKANAEKYLDKGRAIEAERETLYQEMMNPSTQ